MKISVLRIGLISTLFIFSYSGFSQNLIFDPGFEDVKSYTVNGFQYASPGKIDAHFGRLYYKNYFKPQDNRIIKIINDSMFVLAHIGNFCSAAEVWYDRNRGSIIKRLTGPLQKDSLYVIEFYTKHAFGSYITNIMDVGFTTKDFTRKSQLELTPNYIIPVRSWLCDSIFDANEWKKVVVEYKASGNEKNLIVGGIGYPKKFKKIKVENRIPGNFSYFLFDDFVVTLKSNYSEFDFERKVNSFNIYFDKNSFEVKKNFYDELDTLAYQLNQHINHTIELFGHTDSTGTEFGNASLSIKRAESVRNYLVSQGVDKRRITVRGFSSSKPIELRNQEKMNLNRRVEFVIKKSR